MMILVKFWLFNVTDLPLSLEIDFHSTLLVELVQQMTTTLCYAFQTKTAKDVISRDRQYLCIGGNLL